jgi:hypothetical protein
MMRSDVTVRLSRRKSLDESLFDAPPEGFIRLNALRLRIRAMVEKANS